MVSIKAPRAVLQSRSNVVLRTRGPTCLSVAFLALRMPVLCKKTPKFLVEIRNDIYKMQIFFA